MTSVLNVDTIADKAGTGPVGLTKQSAAKAFYTGDMNTSNTIVNDSLNAASVTDGGTGKFTFAITSAMSSVNHTITSNGGTNFGDQIGVNTDQAGFNRTTTQVRFSVTRSTSDSMHDPSTLDAAYFGDLA